MTTTQPNGAIEAMRKRAEDQRAEADRRATEHRKRATSWGWGRYVLGGTATVLPILVATDAVTETGWATAITTIGALSAAAITLLKPDGEAKAHETAAETWEAVGRHARDFIAADIHVVKNDAELSRLLHVLTSEANAADTAAPNLASRLRPRKWCFWGK